MSESPFQLEERQGVRIVRLRSYDGMNRRTRSVVQSLTAAVGQLAQEKHALVIAGSDRFFSAGADLEEIEVLNGPAAYEFSKMGQELMQALDQFPAAVYASVSGYCMGGSLDLALTCHRRIASPHAIFGHRGTALGLITGWGGTQRLPRIIGKARALEMFVAAEKISAAKALCMRLIDAIAADPVAASLHQITR
jgi:enoyl-CoA hydratase/carnithine racemase